jgi:hypothetical protein
MDKNKTHNIKYKIFNGWFLMNTSQVSTRGDTIISGTTCPKKHYPCGKIAVGFFSLHAGAPVCGFYSSEQIPSKYIFMKNAKLNARQGSLSLFTHKAKDTKQMLTTILT